MRILVAAAAVSVSALIAVGVLGVAGAETTPAPPASILPRTVGAQGVANAPIAPEASAEAAIAAYRQAMASAVADGQAKARFLAEKAGATLGAAQSIQEGGGYIQCPEGEEYQGAQPDFGYANGGGIVAGSSISAMGRSTPRARRPALKRHRKKRSAKAAAGAPCTLSTQVGLAYQLS
jgi:hypothetical protein